MMESSFDSLLGCLKCCRRTDKLLYQPWVVLFLWWLLIATFIHLPCLTPSLGPHDSKHHLVYDIPPVLFSFLTFLQFSHSSTSRLSVRFHMFATEST